MCFVNPVTVYSYGFPLKLHGGGSGIILNGDPEKQIIVGLVPDACLWLGPPWLNLRSALELTIFES